MNSYNKLYYKTENLLKITVKDREYFLKVSFGVKRSADDL
jgi:hypothetical protein